jgi:hypothetical protein
VPRTPEQLRRDLARLRESDRGLELFGADGHRYRLNPVRSVAEIRAFEASLGIVLPADYVTFVTEVGNGGAGPFYGVNPLGECDAALGAGTERWHPKDVLVGEPRLPFPHREAWNLPPAEIEALQDAEHDDPRMLAYWRAMDGAIPICHEGCAYRDWLVVTGSERGFVWHDETAGDGGWWPWKGKSGERLTFLAWYEAWLDEGLAGRSFDCSG